MRVHGFRSDGRDLRNPGFVGSAQLEPFNEPDDDEHHHGFHGYQHQCGAAVLPGERDAVARGRFPYLCRILVGPRDFVGRFRQSSRQSSFVMEVAGRFHFTG